MAVGGVSKNEQSSRLSQAMKGRQPEHAQKKQVKKSEKQQGAMAQGTSASKPKGAEEVKDKAQIAKANAAKMSSKGSNVDRVA